MNVLNEIKHRVKLKAYDFNILKSPQLVSKCVVMYHGIDLIENRMFNRRFFSMKHLEGHLNYFKKTYNLLSLQDIMDEKNLSKVKLNVAITFDDGYMNNFKYAFPLFEKYKIPVHFYVTGINNSDNPIKILWGDLINISEQYITDDLLIFGKRFTKGKESSGFTDLKKYIRNNAICGTWQYDELIAILNKKSNNVLVNEGVFDYWKLLSDEQIKIISQSNYVKIGSHGYWHNNLSSLRYKQACEDILRSKQYLENLTQYTVDSIAYPDGSYTREVSKYANDIGFKYQCAVDYKYEEDKNTSYITDRLGLYPLVTPKYIDYLINTGK